MVGWFCGLLLLSAKCPRPLGSWENSFMKDDSALPAARGRTVSHGRYDDWPAHQRGHRGNRIRRKTRHPQNSRILVQENPALRYRGGRQGQRSGEHGNSRPRHTISVRDSLQQQKRALAPCAATFPPRRKAQWPFLRQWRPHVLWGGWGVGPRLLPGWKGRLVPRLRGEPGVRFTTLALDTVLTLRGLRHVPALVRRMPPLHVPWVLRRRGRRMALWQPGLLRGLTVPTHPAPSPIPLGALWEVVMGAGGGWGEWAPTPPQSAWCFVEVSISGQRRMCWTGVGVQAQPGLSSSMKTGCGALCRTSVFEKGGASFKEPCPVFYASGGFGTDFTLNSMLATFRPDLCTFPQQTVSTALVMRSRWTRHSELLPLISSGSRCIPQAWWCLVWSERGTRRCLLDWWAHDPHWWANYWCLRLFSFFSSWLDRATTLLQGPTLSLQMVELECVVESQKPRSCLVDWTPCEQSCVQCVICLSW